MNVSQLLRRTRDLVTSPSRWIQGHLREQGGYCLVGALQYSWKGTVSNEHWGGDMIYDLAKQDLISSIQSWYDEQQWPDDDGDNDSRPTNLDIPEFNDWQQHTVGWTGPAQQDHARVLNVLDKAIARAERRNPDMYEIPTAHELLLELDE